MRAALALVLAATLAPALAHAQEAPSRYGARQAAPPAAPAGDQLPARYLSWNGKTQSSEPAAVGLQPPRPEPMSDWARTASRYPPPIRTDGQPAAAQAAPASRSSAAPAPALPSSIYDAPPPARSAPATTGVLPAAHTGPRLYSLHREFGLQPDPVPVPVHRDGPGMKLANLAPTSLGGAEEPVRQVEERRITGADGKTRVVERPRAEGPPATGLGAGLD